MLFNRSEQVRVLKGIPQPAALCPVDNYGAAVLCRREIKIIDLNKGELRVIYSHLMINSIFKNISYNNLVTGDPQRCYEPENAIFCIL